MRKELDVNVHRNEFREHEESNGTRIRWPRPFQEEEILSAFPFLEKISVTTRKHPYAMLTVIVGSVGTVLVAIASACVILFSSFFTMYGTMQATLTEVRQLRQENAVVTSELKVMRTYNASVLSRQNFIAGLMSPADQKRLNEFDRANPLYQPPPHPPNRTLPDQ